jgi:4-aminobutyrate aminotransferase-like enzyme
MGEVNVMREFLGTLGSGATKFRALMPKPPVMVSGKGSWLFDESGGRYLDFGCGSAVNNLGYAHPVLEEAILKQLKTGIVHSGPHFETEAHYHFYSKLKSLVSPRLTHFHPATNGTEAIEIALKLAQIRTGGSTFISFRGSYHGRTRGALAVSGGKAANGALGVLSPGAAFFAYPRCGSCQRRTSDLRCCGFPETDIREALQDSKNGLGRLAGIIVEPIQGTGGFHVPPASFLSTLRQLADELNIPLIFDEIFTNFGRTGRIFAHDHFGVYPDLLCMGKMVTGGLPGACVAMTSEINDAQPPGSQTSTFQLSPLGAAVGHAGMCFTVDEGLPQRANQIHEQTMQELSVLRELDSVADVRGIGAMNGIEIVKGLNGGPDTAGAKKIRTELLKNGLITYECGYQNHVVGLLPPLIISDDELHEGLGRVVDVVRNCARA